MKFRSIYIAVLSLAFVITGAARAETAANSEFSPTWEITGGAHATFQTASTGNSSVQDYGIIGGVAYFVAPQIELGLDLELALQHQTGDTSHFYRILAGPTYNFSNDIENSVYFFARAGIVNNSVTVSLSGLSVSQSQTVFAYALGLGKRFEVVQHISYSPEVSFNGTGGSNGADGTTSWAIIPLQFSFEI